MNTLNTGIAKLVKSALKGCLALLLAGQSLYLANAQVPYDRILNAADEPQNWLTYNGGYMSQRYSLLDQINQDNVGDLELKWVLQNQVFGAWQSNPIVVDGIMYVTERPNSVMAVDAITGRVFWKYVHTPDERARVCCGANNRGVAVLDDRVFRGTLDARLIALDRINGEVLWDAEVGDVALANSGTMAPLAVKDKVLVGIGGGEFGIRGYVAAYYADTGEQAWKTYTIPGPGEPGHDSWQDDDWMHGGAPVWITGSFDAEQNQVYWGVGNPGPDWNNEQRPGDNLYSDSVIALDVDTGELEWYFQFTPNDPYDYDAVQVPVLADLNWNGMPKKVMMWANRNGFYYTLDRSNGEFLIGKPYAAQTWAQGLDPVTGRPIRVPGMAPTYEGIMVSPPIVGATNWYSPGYSQDTGLFYVTSFDGEQEFFKRDEDYEEGERFTGGGGRYTSPMDAFHSSIRAINPETAEIEWEFPIMPRSSAGITTTAGGLVFTGSADGYFFALDASSGEELWNISLGRRVHAAPMTFAVDGEQFVTIASGNVVYTFGLRD